MYLKVTSVLTINALENGDFLNFILDFLAARHPNSLTRKQSTHLCFFLRPQKQDVSPMSHFDSKGNVPYKPKKTHKPSNSKLLSYVLIYIFNLFILFNKDVCVCTTTRLSAIFLFIPTFLLLFFLLHLYLITPPHELQYF